MFSEAVLDHFRNPRNAGELRDATAAVEVTNTSIACASLLTEELRGRTPAEARGITAEFLSLALGGLPPATFHGAQLAAEAVAALLPQLPSSAG